MQNNAKYQEAIELFNLGDAKYDAAEMMKSIGDLTALKCAADWFLILEEIEEAVKCWKLADLEFSDLNCIMKLMEYSISISDNEDFECYAMKAAQQNHPEAIIKLAYHFQGKLTDIPDQDDPAFFWSRKAATCGDSRSMRCLAEWSRDIKNEGSDSDAEENVQLDWYGCGYFRYKKAAKAGDIHSICMVAVSLFHGIDCKRDVPAALEWFVKASRTAAQPSMHCLGNYYANGEG